MRGYIYISDACTPPLNPSASDRCVRVGRPVGKLYLEVIRRKCSFEIVIEVRVVEVDDHAHVQPQSHQPLRLSGEAGELHSESRDSNLFPTAVTGLRREFSRGRYPPDEVDGTSDAVERWEGSPLTYSVGGPHDPQLTA